MERVGPRQGHLDQRPDGRSAQKLADCAWLVTCTAAGLHRLRELAPRPDRLKLVYHGLDFAHLPAPAATRPPRDGSDAADPVVILSIGRKVEKKGYDDLLDALARLPPTLHWRFEHIGAGELGDALKAQAARLGIAERCTWLGAQPQKAGVRGPARAPICSCWRARRRPTAIRTACPTC